MRTRSTRIAHCSIIYIPPSHMYAYLHGFASGPNAHKATQIASVLKNKFNLTLHVPNLNYPSFSQLSYSNMLTAWDTARAQWEKNLKPEEKMKKWNIIASSMGGYVALRWAELNPSKVSKLIVMCPGFNMGERWKHVFGENELKKWEETGLKEFKLNGENHKVHFEIVKDARENHPAFPDVKNEYEVIIIHGTKDTTVPIELSRKYVENHPQVKLLEVDDGHDLVASLPTIIQTVENFFELKQTRSNL